MSKPAIAASPYKGLIPYSEEDAPFFFGREQKREIIASNLMGSRLTVLHGPSGVGKSSVLRAGVAHHLRQLAQQSLADYGKPEFAVVVFSSWGDDPVAGLASCVQDSVARLLKGQTLDPLPPSRDLTQSLQTWTKFDPNSNRPDLDLLIILDQFEEYFLYHNKEEGEGTFAVELPRAINSPDLRVNFLISIREDALAKLECFKGSIPHLFDNRLSIEHLDRKSAREAIIKPIDKYNELYLSGKEPISIELALVAAILEEIKTGQVVLGQAGLGTVEDGNHLSTEATQIETPYLQMVMTRLWEEEMRAGSRVLRLETLKRLGGAASIVRTHLDKTISTLTPEDQDTASRIFYHLVTPTGTKIAHTAPDLALFAEMPEEQLNPVLFKLSNNPSRILRPVDPPPNQQGVQRYEIFHDVLAPAILDWQTRYTQAKNQARAEKAVAEEAVEREQENARLLKLQQAEALAKAERLRAEEQQRRFEAEHERLEEQKRRANAERRRVRQMKVGLIALILLLIAMAGTTVYAFHQRSAALAAYKAAKESKDVAEKALYDADKARAEALARKFEAQHERDVAQKSKDEAEKAREFADKQKAEAVAQAAAARKAEADAKEQRSKAEHARDDAKKAQGSEKVERQKAEDASKLAQAASKLALSRELAANATLQLSDDPELSMLLAGEALKVDHTKEAEAAYRTTLPLVSNVRAVMRAHKDKLTNAVFSPNGKLIATASEDQTVRLWDTITGEERELKGHEGPVLAIAFSPDGKRLATEAADGTGKIWDVTTGIETATLPELTGLLPAIAFSPDGTRLVTEGGPNIAKVWDVTTGKELFTLRGHKDAISAVGFSPDGKYIITASLDGTAMVWKKVGPDEWKSLPVPEGHKDPVLSAAFSSDSKYIVTTCLDNTAQVWKEVKTDKWEPVFVLKGHEDTIMSAAFDPQGKRIVTASIDGTARVWETSTGRNVAILFGHKRAVSSAVFSLDGKSIVTASFDNTARLWKEVATDRWKSVAELRGHAGAVTSAAFSPDGNYIVTASVDKTARLWNASIGKSVAEQSVAELRGHTNGLWSAAFDSKGKYIVTASSDRTARVWNTSTGESVVLRGHEKEIIKAAFSPDGKYIATASTDKTARIWDAITGHRVDVLNHKDFVWSVAFSPDGQYIVTASKDCTARVWKKIKRVEEWGVQREWELVDELSLGDPKKLDPRLANFPIVSAAFGQDEKAIVTANIDGDAQVWKKGETDKWKPGPVLKRRAGWIMGVAFSPDGKSIVTAGTDYTARVWLESTTGEWEPGPVLRGHADALTSVAFSPDGKYIVTSSYDRTARVWDASTGKSVAELRGHTGAVWSAAFSLDDKYIVTASEDGTARIYPRELFEPFDKILVRAPERLRLLRELTKEEQTVYLHLGEEPKTLTGPSR